MFQLTLRAQTVLLPTGEAVARVTDLTDWTQAPTVRGTWALLVAATQLGSVQSQDVDVVPAAYEPHAFQSGDNADGTVDIPLPGDGVFRVQAVAVPLVLSAAELALATSGRMYYRLDTQQFVYKLSATLARPVTSWADVLDAAATDQGEGSNPQSLLEKSAETYVLSTAELQAGLAKLNLRYLEAPNRVRTVLYAEYARAELLVGGAGHQFDLGLYPDAATSVQAAVRLLGSCLPGFAQSLPAIEQADCAC